MMKKSNNIKKPKKKSCYRVDSESEEEVEAKRADTSEEKVLREMSPDSPDQMMICTQTEEINWNWNSPGASKSCGRRRMEKPSQTKTPKTTHLKGQKLIDEKKASPLMYLRKPETYQSEYMACMTKVLNSIPVRGNNGSQEEKDEASSSSSSSSSSREKPSEVPATKNQQLSLTPVRKVSVKQKSFESLFNDSMDDKLFLCSQEIENQYLNEYVKSEENKGTIKQMSMSSFSLSMARRRSMSPTSSKIEPLAIKKPRNAASNDSLNKSVSSLSIPDDSFDDCLASCVVDESRYKNTYSKSNLKLQVKSRTEDGFGDSARQMSTPNNRKFIRQNSSPIQLVNGQQKVSSDRGGISINGLVKISHSSNGTISQQNLGTTTNRTVHKSKSGDNGPVCTKEQIEMKRREALKIREERERQRKLKQNCAIVKR